MADQKTPEDDKSINDLLKEYASDVKTNDLDDFLKESNDDAYESAVEDEEDDDAEDDAEVSAAEPRKSSVGVLSILLILIACGAVGAGAWMYLNRDEGMTSIMGGFMGGQDEGNAPASQMPPAPPIASETPQTPPAPGTEMASPMPLPDAPAQPMPIMNEPGTDNAAATPGADVVMPEPKMPSAKTAAVPAPSLAPSATPAPAPVATAAPVPLTEKAPAAAEAATKLPTAGADAQNAVADWNNGETPANTDPKAKLPEKAVEPMKAKPVAAPKQAKKTEPLMENKTAAVSAPKAAAPKDYVSGGMDGALLPPFMAIQAAKRNGTASAPAPVASAASVPSAAMKAVPPPYTPSAAPASSEPALRTVPLAINGGRSMPDNGETRAYAQIPDTTNGTAPRSTPEAAAAPMVRAPAPSAPVADTTPIPAPTPVAAAPAATSGNGPAAGFVAQAQAAEKSGAYDKAVDLYEQALEADAVYGDGKSIDRGSVYDRIGAIKNGHP